MNRLLSAVVLGIGLFRLGGMDARAGVEEDAVNGVIRQQLEAFRKNDFEAAYGFAFSGIREQLTRAEFEAMVRVGFAAMVKPGLVEFGGTEVVEGNAMVRLQLTAEDGTTSAYQYSLEKEKGGWRIAGVIPIESKPAATLVLNG